jgi:hypothetical protein
VVLIGNSMDVDKVPNVELELFIGTTKLGVDKIWLGLVTREGEIDEPVRILEGGPLESSGIELAADEILVEDAGIGLLVDVTENILKDREDIGATLVKDEADVEITADGTTPSVDVGRLVDGSGVEKGSVLVNNDDCERDPNAAELPG